MSAADDDTELRDLLIQNLENSGVLNKLKAEMRAAVFLAMEEQDKVENKTPLINENLKKCLNTRDGRLAASLIVDFLQIFNLDFTLAVFQPELNMLNSLDSRGVVCTDLGLSESEVNRNCPLLLELVRRGRQPQKLSVCSEEPSQKQITNARRKFDFYDKDHCGLVLKDDLHSIFMDLFPNLNKNMLETFITDELKATDRTFSKKPDVKLFLEMYKHLFAQCRSVVVQDSEVSCVPEDRTKSSTHQDVDGGTSPAKGYLPQQPPPSLGLETERVDQDLEVEDDLDDEDSFFDDPLPKPQKTYGCVVPLSEESLYGPVVSPMRRGESLNDLSVLAADSEGQRDDHSQSSVLRKPEVSGGETSPAVSLSEFPRPDGGGRGPAGGAGGGGSSMSEQSHSRNGGSHCRDKGPRDPKAPNDKSASLHLDEDVEYDDDFNSHRSDFSKSELSIGEEIEEVSIEGPDSSEKFDETTQDQSVSQFSLSQGADYMEDVS